MITKADVRRLVGRAMDGWERTYLHQRKQDIEESVAADKDPDARTRAQGLFIGKCVAHMMLSGATEDNLWRVRRFLAFQREGRDRARFEVSFHGPFCPTGPKIFVNSKQDFDVADIFELTDFERMTVRRQSGRTWTRKGAERFLKEVVIDLDHDDFCPYLKLSIEGAYLHLDGEVKRRP